jgi:hypothetical protein
MINTKPLQDLLAKDMNRKEFLAHVGGTMLAVIGITGLVKKLADPYGKSTHQAASGVATSYGSSAYGGVDPGTQQRSLTK